MPKLVVELPKNRDLAGRLSLIGDDGSTIAGPFAVAGRALDGPARAHGNPRRLPLLPYGDTPLGTYRLTRRISMRGADIRSVQRFGRFGIAVLTPAGGDAALADAAGRFEIWVHGGPPSRDCALRATNGALRLANSDQRRLMRALADLRAGVSAECKESANGEAAAAINAAGEEDYGDPPRLGTWFDAGSAKPFTAPPSVHADSRVYLGEYSSGLYFSDVDTDVIANNEGGTQLSGYVPANDGVPIGNSGVTICAGFDLGQQTVAGLNEMGIPADIVTTFTPYLGLQGTDAQDFLAANPLTLTADQCDAVNETAFSSYSNDAGQSFELQSQVGSFSDLPWQAQTVIADLTYAWGDLASFAPNFWSQVTNGDWQAAYDNLLNFSSKPGVAGRAAKDAPILYQAIQAGTLPQKKP